MLTFKSRGWSRHCTLGSTNYCNASSTKMLPYTQRFPILCHYNSTRTLSTSLLLPLVWTCQIVIIISFQNLQVISRGKISFYVQPLASIPKVLLRKDIYKLLPRWQCIVSYSDHFKQWFPSCLNSWTPPLQGNAPIQQLLLLLRAPKPAKLGSTG